ncbi:MAG: AmmeMemoRadiSam system protein B, partial [Candidatus Eisenbacteria bacterium]
VFCCGRGSRPARPPFRRRFLSVAPGLRFRERLVQVGLSARAPHSRDEHAYGVQASLNLARVFCCGRGSRPASERGTGFLGARHPIPSSGPSRRLALLLLALLSVSGAASAAGGVRPEAVAGSFYPADPAELRRAIEYYLEDAVSRPVQDPLALVAPHAGYIYSAQIAADAYKQVEGLDVSTVVILGTNHTVPSFRGAALWAEGSFRTPLGEVPVDEEFARSLMRSDGRFVFRKDAHEREHSVEVQVPFVQVLFPKAKIVPLVVGSGDLDLCAALGDAIADAAAGRKVLLVASSDLSHYPAYEDAVEIDTRVLRAIAEGDLEEVKGTIDREMNRGAPGLSTCACGEGPVLTAMRAAKRLNRGRGTVISYANSGDAAIGDPGRVVGYGAVVFGAGEPPPDLSGLERPGAVDDGSPLRAEEKRFLLRRARRAIEQHLLTRTAPLPRADDPALRAPRGAFVTLKKEGELRGCVGHMAEDRPLDWVVTSMALQAAFNDRRFAPLTRGEWDGVQIEISVLTPRRAIASAEEIVIGRDGVVVEKNGRSAVFLPQVAPEQGWGRDEMLDHLCAKAGLAGGCWREEARLFVFQADVFHEGEAGP